jgi:hypothetical protein
VHQLLNEVQAGHVSRDRATLNDLINAWLENGGPAGENTRAVYAVYIKNHVEDSIGLLTATSFGSRTSTAGTPSCERTASRQHRFARPTTSSVVP